MPTPKLLIVFLCAGLLACSNGGSDSGKKELNIEGQALDAFDCDLYPSEHEGCWLSEPCANNDEVSSRKLLRITDDEFHFYTANYEVRDCLGASSISTDVLRPFASPLASPEATDDSETFFDVRPYVAERNVFLDETTLVIGYDDDELTYGRYAELDLGSMPTDYADGAFTGGGVDLTPDSNSLFSPVYQTKTLVDVENDRLCFSNGVYFVAQRPVNLITEEELLSGSIYPRYPEEFHVFSWIDAVNNDINYENCFERLN